MMWPFNNQIQTLLQKVTELEEEIKKINIIIESIKPKDNNTIISNVNEPVSQSITPTSQNISNFVGNVATGIVVGQVVSGINSALADTGDDNLDILVPLNLYPDSPFDNDSENFVSSDEIDLGNFEESSDGDA